MAAITSTASRSTQHPQISMNSRLVSEEVEIRQELRALSSPLPTVAAVNPIASAAPSTAEGENAEELNWWAGLTAEEERVLRWGFTDLWNRGYRFVGDATDQMEDPEICNEEKPFEKKMETAEKKNESADIEKKKKRWGFSKWWIYPAGIVVAAGITFAVFTKKSK